MVALLFGPAQNWAAHLNGQPLAPPDPPTETAPDALPSSVVAVLAAPPLPPPPPIACARIASA